MNQPTKILCFAGSARAESLNKKLAMLGAKVMESLGVESQFVDLKDYPLPLYDGDFEQNNPYPENAAKLKQLLQGHQGFLIASPEYNSSITALLKNTLDWITRSEDKGTDLSAFSSKIIAIVSASPGMLGGLRGLVHIRSILSNIGAIVIPNQLAIGQGFQAFDKTGSLTDSNQSEQFHATLEALVQTTKRFNIDLEKCCNQMYAEYCKKQMG